MSVRRYSIRSRLLASVMISCVPATAMATDYFVGPGPTVTTQIQLSGTDRLSISSGGGVFTTGQSAILITGDTAGDFFIVNGGNIGVNGPGAGISMAGSRSGPIYIGNSATGVIHPTAGGAIQLGGALGPVTIDNAGHIGGGVPNVIVTGSGADSLNLRTGSLILGTTLLGGGFDTINLYGTSNAKGTNQELGTTLGGEQLNVHSGYWTLKGEVGADTVVVADGATFEIDDVNAGGDGAFISSNGDVLTIDNHGAVVMNTADTRLDIYADNLHLGGPGTLELTGGGSIQYGQNVTMTGRTTITNGKIVVTGDNIASPITVGAAGVLQVGAAYSAPDADGYVTLVGGGGTTGSLSGDVVNNGQVIFDRATESVYAGAMSGTGAVTKYGVGVLALTGVNTYTGATTLAAGGLRISSPFASSGVAMANGTSLSFANGDDMTYAGSLSGSGIVSKMGSGALTLSGANTNTGATVINAGKLVISGSYVGPVFVSSDSTLEVKAGGSARLVEGSGATVINAGTIETPLLTTGTTATVSFSALNNTLTNSGVIRSYNGNAIRFGAGNDTLNLATGSSITGRVQMGLGTDTVNLAGTLATETPSQVFGDIFGSEIVNVNSGYWSLLGEIEADQVNIASGATFKIDDVNAGGDGAFISSSGDVLTINNNGAVVMNTADTRLDIYADNLHLGGAGTLELTGGGAIQYGQNVTMTGRTTVTNGTVVVTGDNIASPFTVGAQGVLRIGAAYSAPDADGYVTIVPGGGHSGSITGDVALNVTGQLIFDRADDSTYSGNIAGGNRVVKRGAGVLTLAGSSVTPFQVEQGGLLVTGTLSPLGTSLISDGAALTIASTGTSGRLGGNGATITNAGTIDFIHAGGFGGAMIELGRASTVNNSGVIRASNGFAIHFRDEADTLNLFTGSNIIGRVEMGGGTDTINLAGTSATRTTSQVLGKIFGSEILNVNSGYWTMTGETEADQVNIASGASLDVDSIGAAPGEGGFISANVPFLTIANNGALIVSTDDTRIDQYADDLHLSGAGTVELRGGGVIQYGANVALTGATTITDGMLLVTGNNIASPITVASAGTLRVGAAYSAPDVDGYVNIVAGGGTSGSINGNVANNGAVIFDRADASTYSGSMSGTGTLTKSGAGVLTMSGANSYTGATTVTGGGLVVSAPFASSGVNLAAGTNLTFTGPNALSYGGVISGSGGLTKTGAGVLTLSGANTYNAVTNIEAGELAVTGSVSSPINVREGARLNVASTGSVRSVAFNGATIINAGTIATPGLTTGTGATIGAAGGVGNTLTNSGVIRSYNGHAVRFGGGDDVLNLATGSSIIGRVDMSAGNDVINLAGTSATKAGSQTFGDIFGSETLNVISGYWTLNSEIEADFVNVANGAILEMDSVGAAPGAGGFISGNAAIKTVVNSGAIIQNTSDTRLDIYANDLHIGGSGTVELKGGGVLQYGANTTLTGATTVTNGTLVVTGDAIASAINVGAQGALRIGAAYSAPDADGFVTIVSGGGTTGSVASNIANNGAVIFDRANASTYGGAMSGTGSVTKNGAGVLTLSGANTYTGATTVNAGGLVVSGGFASSGVSLAGGTGLTFGGANALTYAGVVSGGGSLTKTGAGTTTLSGANTYTGATTVNAGTLAVTGSIASQSVSVAGGANFTFGSAANQTYGGVVSGAGSLTKSGAGALTLTGVNTYTGATTVSGGSLILASTLGSNVTVNSGATLQIGTGGTTGHLTGDLRADGTVIFSRSDDYLYAGAFSGGGSLIKRGAGLLTLDGLYTFSGTTTIEGGTIKISQLDAGGSLVVGSGSTVDLSGGNQTVGGLAGGTGSTVNIQNAVLTVNQAPSTTPTVFSGALTGSGALVVTGGGILDLAGTNTYTGPTTVSGGTLKVNGSITSPVTVNSGGTLGGSGTIGGAVTIGSGGSLSPGNSPGVTNIAGPLTLAAGSNTVIEVDPTATVKNDRINVTAGSATIVAGAKLDVRPLGAIANYDRVSDYTILTATGGVTGTFGANVTSTMALLTPSVSYTANEVKLRLIRNDIRFASLAATANQAAVADAAEATGPSGAAYGALVGQDQAGARTGYDALSGEVHGAAASLLIDEGRHQRAALLSQAGSKGVGAWARIHNGEANVDAANGSAAARDRGFGVAGGGQVENGVWTLGFGLGYGSSDITVDDRASLTEVETLRAGVYAGTEMGAWRFRLGADAARHDVEARRGVIFPGVSETVSAKYDGSSRQIFGEVAYVMDVAGGSLEPFVELAGVWAKTDAFSETGGTLGLDVAGQDRSLTFATVGARFSGAYDTGGAVIRPQLSLAWRRAGGDIEGTTTAGFGTSSFTVTGAGVAKDTALIDAGAGFDITSSVTGSLSYSGAVSSEVKDHAIRAGLSVRF